MEIMNGKKTTRIRGIEMEDVKRLPKWVQNKIIVLERNLHNLQAELRQIYGAEETNVSFSKGILEEFNLPKDVRITFKIKPHQRSWIDCYITNDGKLRVSGNNSILINPSASNCFTVENKEKED